jgi:DNA-binding Xre family transcriptional regulator
VSSRADRLEIALKHAKIKQNDLSRAFGVSRAYLTQLKKGDQPGHDWWPKIAAKLSVPVEWLLTGDNPPAWACASPEAQAVQMEGLTDALDGLTQQVEELRKQQADTDALRSQVISYRLQRAIRHARASLADLAQVVGLDIHQLSGPIFQPIQHLEQVRKIAVAIGEDPQWIITGNAVPQWFADELIPAEKFGHSPQDAQEDPARAAERRRVLSKP